jgi:hypothetical protein
MNSVVIAKLSTALLKMLDPVETSILNLRRNTLLHSATLDVGYKRTRNVLFTNVLFEKGRHKPYTAFG